MTPYSFRYHMIKFIEDQQVGILMIRPLQVILLFLVPRPHAFGKFQIVSILNSLYTACAK